MAQFTYHDFQKQFPDENACLDKIFKLRYGHLQNCPKCNKYAKFRRVKTRRCYQCTHCYEQFYPCAGTVFEKSRIPLKDWFYITWLFTTTRNGVAAKEIERQLGCTYKTAFRLGHHIRLLMERIGKKKLRGIVEVDTTYYKNKGYEQDPVTQLYDESAVIAMVERMGNVRAFQIPTEHKEVLYHFIKEHIDKTAHISTDEAAAYKFLEQELGMKHGSVNHSQKEWKKGWVHGSSVECYFGQLKRMIYGTHLHVSVKYLQNYISECSTRFNNRTRQEKMFEIILRHLPVVQS